jgi:hypothetical protein
MAKLENMLRGIKQALCSSTVFYVVFFGIENYLFIKYLNSQQSAKTQRVLYSNAKRVEQKNQPFFSSPHPFGHPAFAPC